MADQEFQGQQQMSDAAAHCLIQASPHQAIFQGPFHSQETYAESSVKNVSPVRLLINIKVSEPLYLRSSPRCFILKPGEKMTIHFTHQPFVMIPGETYDRHQVLYLVIVVNELGTGAHLADVKKAKELKNLANESGIEWYLCRMRIGFQFTDEDQQAADQQYQQQQQYADQQGVQV
uniref:Major sperm protein n=1 Tax=Romanomermis culicivorax TaxID=13658 RepID=A0A915L528_ROMCU